ncbi:hypothetical protein [Nocardioides xinjiangensis]|uniref:hypothetical protein n=1 Tax=Nocardioides xinjiangensis TaxID=2817376 RepID=UPI001B306499|nr:hypothetical protein [Nocardioides sp. SYSU D00778]
MVSMILISTVAILVAIVGCAVIWRLDAQRAEEIRLVRPERARPALGASDDPGPASSPAP